MRLALLTGVLLLTLTGCDDDSVKPRPESPAPATVLVRADGTGDYPTIQAAIDASSDGDIIHLADGVYRGPGNRELDYKGLGITIRSLRNDPERCVIDCESTEEEKHNGFTFDSGEPPSAVLQAVTITGADYLEQGSALRIYGGASPTFIDVVFEANRGTAVVHGHASPSFYRCQFLNNEGGAMLASNSGSSGGDSSTLLVGCVFEGNVSLENWGNGAAIYNSGNSLTAIRCVFRNNKAYNSGGAILSSLFSVPRLPSLTLIGCWFEGNEAREVAGGAIQVMHRNVLIEGCTFVGNRAGGYGGGAIRFAYGDGNEIVRNSTFVGNHSTDGAAIRTIQGATPRIESSIIAFNAGSAPVICNAGAVLVCSDIFGNEYGDWVGCVTDQANASGNMSVDPMFCDPARENLNLRVDSPCADKTACGWIGAWRIGCRTVPKVPAAR